MWVLSIPVRPGAVRVLRAGPLLPRRLALAVGVVVVVLSHQPRVGPAQAGADLGDGGGGDDQHGEEGQGDHQGPDRPRSDQGGQRAGGQVAHHASAGEHALEGLVHTGHARGQVGDAGHGHGQHDQADRDPPVVPMLRGMAEAADRADQQHDRQDQRGPAEGASTDVVDHGAVAGGAAQAPPLHRADHQGQDHQQQTGAVASVLRGDPDIAADLAHTGADRGREGHPERAQGADQEGLLRRLWLHGLLPPRARRAAGGPGAAGALRRGALRGTGGLRLALARGGSTGRHARYRIAAWRRSPGATQDRPGQRGRSHGPRAAGLRPPAPPGRSSDGGAASG